MYLYLIESTASSSSQLYSDGYKFSQFQFRRNIIEVDHIHTIDSSRP